MDGEPDIAVPARALGDPARGRMVSALIGDRQIPAGELARRAGISPSTASEHLRVLLDAGIVGVEHRGRNRFYRLADDDVARVVEALLAIAPRTQVRSLRQSRESTELRAGRTCYDHLAGDVGLRIAALLVEARVISELRVGLASDPPQPFPHGSVAHALGIRPPEGQRPWARGCLDWTGRRPHAAGQVGAQVLNTLLTRGWVARRSNTRAVLLTDFGEEQLAALEVL